VRLCGEQEEGEARYEEERLSHGSERSEQPQGYNSGGHEPSWTAVKINCCRDGAW
jgi:hypothetical protein